jgi:hypothetical protein
MSRVAILGGMRWTDHNAVRRVIKTLMPGTLVLLDDDPFDTNSAARRECRCSHLVSVTFNLPSSTGRKAVEARMQRDDQLFKLATRVVVFGDLSPDRENTLVVHERRGLPVERRHEESDTETAESQ